VGGGVGFGRKVCQTKEPIRRLRALLYVALFDNAPGISREASSETFSSAQFSSKATATDVCAKCWARKKVTVAILAQGTIWAVAVTQAFLVVGSNPRRAAKRAGACE
jgi:hypothetical protein